MKKKILLIIMMFMLITNVNALTFNVDVTNIEDEGNNGTIGSITNIDVANKTIDAYFQDIGDEVSFSITVTNTGDRAGTLRNIEFESGNDKIEYTSNLPENGLAINGNDTNKVIVTAKVKEGAVNGKTTSEVKIKYTYDEGSCPEGEILSEDESMCLCPEGMERNEEGICVTPEKPVECASDEIYNSEKKICEKKVVPVVPSNPKTLDNIILITLLFFVSGLGIYAVMFKKLNTNKKKVTGGVITGVITLTLSFTVLASVFGLDNLLSAIVNPITKSKELVVKVNEEIDLIETWDGECSLDVSELTPENIFQGGSGTKSDPYQVKTAEQLSCFAKSVNNGTTYEGQYIKQTKNIKLNDNLNDQATNGDLSNANLWLSAGVAINSYSYDNSSNPHFSGTYDGDNKVISGLYLTDDSAPTTIVDNYDRTRYSYVGMFSHAIDATFKNMILSDVYMVNTREENSGYTGALLGYGYKNLTLNNIKTYGKGNLKTYSAGIVSSFIGNNEGKLSINNVENNIDLNFSATGSGIIHYVERTPNIVIKNTRNNGDLSYASTYDSNNSGILGRLTSSSNILIANSGNTGNFTYVDRAGSFIGGVAGEINTSKLTMENCYNTGNFTNTGSTFNSGGNMGGLVGIVYGDEVFANNLYNSGNIDFKDEGVNFDGMDAYHWNSEINAKNTVGGIFGRIFCKYTLTNSYNTGDFKLYGIYVGGLVGKGANSTESLIENCYNTGDITSASFVGGIIGLHGGTLRKSYNTGTITVFSGDFSGGLIAQGGSYPDPLITNSYNEGEIIVTTYGKSLQVGGLCGAECSVENSYNRGDMDFKHQPGYVGGIVGNAGSTIKNVYNSGNITVENIVQPSRDLPGSIQISGIMGTTSSNLQNTYNLGNIETYYNGDNNLGFQLSGISYRDVSNSVNTGNITLTINQPYTKSQSFYLAGISDFGKVTNSFNAGTFVIDDSPLGHSIYDEEFDSYKHSIYVGEINSDHENGTSGNKFNTDPTNKSYYCRPEWSYCTQADLDAAGVYSNEGTPDILSIINGDNAFNDELDEDGLPTLKVFNN